MSDLPLYTNLSKNLPSKDLLVREKQEFIQKVSKLNNSGKELVYTLICFYNDKNEKEIGIPYECQVEENIINNTSNLTWDFLKFPIKLRRILYKFVIMHTKNMEEENTRFNSMS